jgi:hypothetical protein
MTIPPDIERIALLGWRVVPATARKKGMFKGYLDAATTDLDQIERWAREYPGCCWKVLPAGSGVWFLDVDVPGETHRNDGAAALRDLCALHGPLPPRPHGRSPSGGHLLAFRDAGHPIAPGSARPAPGLDTLARTVCPMVPPSRRASGAYRWVVAPWEVAAPVAPDWLLAAVAPPPAPAPPRRPMVPTKDRAVNALMRSFPTIASAAPGTRNSALLRRATLLGGFVAAGAIDRGIVERELVEAGIAAGQTRSEATSTVRSGLRRGEERPIEWGRA